MIPDLDQSWTAAAAERLALLGDFVAWEIAPPLPTAVTALTGSVWATAALALLAGLAGAWAGRRFGPLWLAAPAKWAALLSGSFGLFFFWAAAPLGLWKWPLALLWLTTRPLEISWIDAIAVAELGLLLGAKKHSRVVAGFAILVVALFFVPLPSPTPSFAAFPPVETALEPALLSAVTTVASPAHPEESVLWLRAAGQRSVLSTCSGKFVGQLESSDWLRHHLGACQFSLPINGARAVMASRSRLEGLPPIRGPLDTAAIESYVLWAERPESVGYDQVDPGEIRVRAHLGPDDVVLVRRVAEPAWRATVDGRTIEIQEDPLGLMVLDPARTGWVEIRLSYQPTMVQRLPELFVEGPDPVRGPFPTIAPDGVVDAVDFTGPPFAPGGYLTLFGRNYLPEKTVLLLDDAELTPLYVSETQINARLPEDFPSGSHELRVVTDGRASLPATFEVAE